MANTLVFVDLPAGDPAAAAEFYRAVMGWEVEGRPSGVFYRIVPGGEFLLDDGSPSGVGNLHLGLYSTAEPRPDPDRRHLTRAATGTATPRVYVLVPARDDQDPILEEAERRGAAVLWRHRYWDEFDGWHSAFEDPWGNQIVLWSKPNTSERGTSATAPCTPTG